MLIHTTTQVDEEYRRMEEVGKRHDHRIKWEDKLGYVCNQY
jgi:hypothetical protein